MNNNIIQLQKKLKINFKNSELLLQAITHKSFNSKKNYEQLEFLGDRVLGISLSERLIELYPNEKVGTLDKKLASLVNKNKCFEVGKILNLDKFLLVGNSKKNAQNLEKKIISDCCESIIGAIFLEKGFDVAKKFILKIWNEFLINSKIAVIDDKTKLQEFSLKHFKILPVYKVFSSTGPKHKPNFKVGVKLKNTKVIFGNGSSKKKAEQLAAKGLLKNLNQS